MPPFPLQYFLQFTQKLLVALFNFPCFYVEAQSRPFQRILQLFVLFEGIIELVLQLLIIFCFGLGVPG